MTPDPFCRTHSARAGWTCTVCHRQLCRRCAWWRPAGHDIVVVCRSCRALAHPILIPRPMASFPEMMRHVVQYPWVGEGKFVLTTGFVTLGLVKLCWLPGEALATILMLSYLFHVIHQSWTGQNQPPGFDESADIFSYWIVGFRALIAFGLALLPVALYTAVAGWHRYDPLEWGCIAIGALWAPIGLMRAAVRAGLGEVVNPLAAYVAVRRMGREYIIAAGVFWVFVGAWFAGGALADHITDVTGVPILPVVVLELPRLYLAMMAARVLGIVLFTHGDDIGYGSSSNYLVPILGDLLPQDEAPLVEEIAKETTVEPIELPPDSAPGVVVDTFVPYQPGEDNGAIELDEPEMPVSIARPAAAPRPASVDAAEDLMPEEEFLATAYQSPAKE